MIKHTQIRDDFIYPQREVIEPAFKFGSNKIKGTVLREDGDWRDYLPPFEPQERNGIESSACFIEAQQHAIATIQEEQYDLPDQNYSSRFNAQFSNASPDGGDPLLAADSFRHDGLIPEDMLPFSEIIQSWQEFNSFKGGNEKTCIEIGKEFTRKWNLKYDVVFERGDSVEEKYYMLRDALKFSPVPMSVSAWYLKGDQYVKPQGARDNHLVLCVYVDDSSRPYWLDTYEPYLKMGEPFYASEFAMRWTVDKKVIGSSLSPVKLNLFQRIIKWLKEYYAK
jgi:hypothetical protein